MANFRLGENQKALDDLQVVIGKNPEAISAKRYRVIALARLGKKQDAQSELETFQKGDAPEPAKLYLAAVVAAETGEGANKAFETLERAIQKQPNDAELRYDAARAFSLASRAIARSDKAKGRQLQERCLQLLRATIKSDDADFGKMEEDADLDPIRDDPACAAIMNAGRPDRRYAAAWISDANFEATSIHGLNPAAHFEKVPGTHRTRLPSRILVGEPDHNRGTGLDRLGLAPPGGQGGDGTRTGWRSGRARAAVALVRLRPEGGVGLAPLSGLAWCRRPTRPQFRRQLAG